MKTKEELSEIKEEVEKLDKKLHELTEEELEQVTGGGKAVFDFVGKFVAEDVAVVDNFVFANGGGAALPSVVIDTTYK